ncbi:MAG: hypothetical protein WC477_04395 [Patescibacteria group bacterium]
MAESVLSNRQNNDPPKEEIPWLKWIGERLWYPRFRYAALPVGCRKPIYRLSVDDMKHVEEIVEKHLLPCQYHDEGEIAVLIIRLPVQSADSNDEDSIIARIYEQQVPRGDMPHPLRGTIGRARLASIAMSDANIRACHHHQMDPGSIRPPTI